jgi:6-phosphogluconate dehydrogenase
MPAGKRVIWLMLIMKAYKPTLNQLYKLLDEGDMIIDGGNSRWRVTQARHKRFARRGIHYVDVGTSGGIYGRDEGYAVMVGATDEEFQALLPVLKALAPPTDGMVHAGETGCGHYCKQLHNGIEYGMMAAFAEGIAMLFSAKKLGLKLRSPLDILKSWREGSIVKSFLLEVMIEALSTKDFESIAPEAGYSGEANWTIDDSLLADVPTPVIAAALFSRMQSKKRGDLTAQILAAARRQFGNHPVTMR